MIQLSKIISATVMALLALASCTTSDEPGGRPEASPAHKIEISQKEKQTVMKGNKHAFNSWETICKLNSNNDGNQFFSPISLQMALSLVANGADGDILNELIALYTEGNDEEGLNNLNELNKKLIEELPLVDKSAKLCFANSLWCDRLFDFKDEYAERCSKFYSATTHKYDKGTEKARKDFNKWASDKTNGMIPEFLKTPPLAEAMLANATYFKGYWKHPFSKNNTRKEDFFCLSGDIKKVDMMHSENYYFIGKDNSDMSYVEIPYLNGGFSMNILMPKKGADFDDCVKRFAEEDIEWEKSGKVNVSVPKFTIEADYTGITEAVKGMGVAHINNPVKNMLENCNFYVGDIKQVSKIIIDEVGTEAAAVTTVAMAGGSYSPQLFEIELNRPFFFTITEQSSGAILFMGKVAQF